MQVIIVYWQNIAKAACNNLKIPRIDELAEKQNVESNMCKHMCKRTNKQTNKQTKKRQQQRPKTPPLAMQVECLFVLIAMWRHIESVHSKSLESFLYELLSRKSKTTRLDQCIQYSKFNTQGILLCSSRETTPE